MATPDRNTALAQIHVAKKQLRLSDPDYRVLLSERFGVLSSAALNDVQREQLLAEFERRGWRRGWAGRGRGKPKVKGANYVAARGKDTDQLAKIRAMLAAANRTIEYGDALAKRLAKVDRLEWATPEQLRKIIAALTYDARRRERAAGART